MAFHYHQFDTGVTPSIAYITGTAGETFVVGTALKVAAGGVTKCSGTETPAYICVGPRMADDTVPVTRVARGIVYAAPLSVAGTTLKVGEKVTIAADGMALTATTTAGVAEIVGIMGTAAGDLLAVRFA